MSARVLELEVASEAIFRGLRAAKQRLWASDNVGTLLVGTRHAILVRKGFVAGIPTHPLMLISRVAGRDRTLRIRSLPHPAGVPIVMILGSLALLVANTRSRVPERAPPEVFTWLSAHPTPWLLALLVVVVLETMRRAAKHGDTDVQWTSDLVDRFAKRLPPPTTGEGYRGTD